MNWLARCLAVASCLTAIHAVADSPSTNRPNVIVILVDDMGFSDIGPYGSEIPTPNLDAMASGGVRFSQFYNTGRCCPTRATLLTGLYAHQAGVGWMTTDQNAPGYRGRLNEHCMTIAQVMKPAGYFTAMTGKWHVGFEPGVTPKDRGFDRSLNLAAGGVHFSSQTGSKGSASLYLDGEALPLDSPQFNPPWYGTDLWTDQGLNFIDEAIAAEKPFFWYLAHCAPHFPIMAPETTIAKYRGKYMKGWDKLREERHQRQIASGLVDPTWELEPRPEAIPAWDSLSHDEQVRYDDMMAIYAAMIEEIDTSLGKLVEGLRERGQLDNTLILFMSDNGGNAEAGVKGRYEGTHPGDPHSNVFIGQCWAHLNNTPFRLYKHYNHEGGIATPLVAHLPVSMLSASTPKSWIKTPVHLVDLMATCVDVSDATYPETLSGETITPMQGQSLVPLLTGHGDFAERPLYWEHEGNAAIRVGDWKLVRRGIGGPWELFDLEADRTEQHDLAASQPDVAAKLTEQWRAWARSVGAMPKPAKKDSAAKKPRKKKAAAASS